MAGLASKTYGHALFTLAKEQKQTEALMEEALVVSEVLKESPELLKFYNHPKVSLEEKKQLTEQCFAHRVSDSMTGFLMLIVENGRQNEMEDSLREFVAEVKEDAGIGLVEIRSALPLSELQKRKLEARLLATTHYRSLETDYRVDANLIGGLLIRIGDRVMDASIRTQLSEMTKELQQIQI